MTCETCNTKFSYFKLLKSFWFAYQDIKCNHCDSTFEHKLSNRVLGGLLVMIPIFISFMVFEDKPVLVPIIGFILMSMVLSLSLPFIMKFSRFD
ncbi:cxxc_20_cxxc family protein [Psychroflexus torquis ATCC 700755]|uniref:Cxxc_20_cxxc family protein n=1 Tax=Psychroflexus torquis (strain ATCC 700755 / CIP 106069 / ACAM 623) TaxID=313595 RepID=K4IAK7_PSYTT|nr:TIGR04104 family putative zinc finger protein [Psychroflexus torquis]AFU67647.1 cxxc_20_cxxc family protein [Psychroflexus torquis ATCC 700755]